MSSSKTEKALANFARFYNAKHAFGAGGSVGYMWLPGVTYEHLDRSGRLDAWKVTKLFEVNRLSRVNSSWFPLSPGSRLIMFAQSITVNLQFHKSIAQDWPIVMRTDITEIGTTSFTLRNQIVDGDDGSGEIFAESKNRVVCVDMASRKSTPLLPEFHALHAEYANKIGDTGKFPTFDAPKLDAAEKVTTMQTTMRHSDQDFLFHTNQGVYFRLSQDCACLAAEAGTLKQFDKDMCFYPIRQADALHKGESFPGDELMTYCWEDPVLEMTMNFVVKKQEKEIFYARLKYYDEDEETG